MSRIGSLFQNFRTRGAAERVSETHEQARWVVAGLGNPEKKWFGSRHNIGFMVVDRIAATKHASVAQKKFKGLYGEVKFGAEPAILIKPQTYYNLSGESVGQLMAYFNVPSERLIVVHDELDLEANRIMIKRGGGDAGNRGVRSLIESLGNGDFIRVRVGISHPAGERDTKDYLLEEMSPADAAAFENTIARAAEAVEAIIVEGLSRAMNRFNQRS
jgi:PTH1 family peptidyl-tRNA hydrolase